MYRQRLGLVLGMIFFAAACGGTPRNTALKNRVSEKRLAPLSGADRGAEAEAHQEVFLSEWQLAFTKGQLKGAKLEINIAKNNLASAKLGTKSALLEKKAADESGDINRIKAATQAALVSERETEVHTIAIERAKQSLAYLKKRLNYEEGQFRSFEAKLEYARAQSLSSAGIVPPNFKLATYKSQYSDRKSQAKSQKSAVDAEQKRLAEVDTRLATAKSLVASAKNSKAIPAETSPVSPMPALPPSMPEVKVPATSESTPGETTTGTSSDTSTNGDSDGSQPETGGNTEGASSKPEPAPSSSKPEPASSDNSPSDDQSKESSPTSGAQQ